MKISQAFAAWTIAIAVIAIPKASAAPIIDGLLDPLFQSLFEAEAPNALDPGFIYQQGQGNGNSQKPYNIEVKEVSHNASLKGDTAGTLLPPFPIYGYALNDL